VLSAVAFQAEPNRSYFVRIEAVSGTRPVRTETRLVSESEGRRAIGQSQFAGAAPAVIAAPRAAAPKPTPKPAPSPRVAKPAAPPPAAKPAPQAARRPPPPAPKAAPAAAREPEETGWDIALIAKGGIFKMASGDQMVGGVPSTFDTTSKPAAGVEIEWRSRSGLALGGEVFYYKNELVTNTPTVLTAEQKVYAGMLNGKYYFRAADWFYPYVGVGAGLATASYGGNLTGKASGPAFQGLAGAEFRLDGVGFHLQFKYLGATTDGKLANGTTEKVKIGGAGVLAGISLIF
jgi:opacity protein-like surface antigen